MWIKIGTLACALGSLSLAGGCASSFRTEIEREFEYVPEVSRTNMTSAVSCMASTIQSSDSANAFIFLVRDVQDGTVKDHPYSDGPLADAGRIQLIHMLSEHLGPHVGLVPDTFPYMFNLTGNEEIGLDRFGVVSDQNFQSYVSIYEPIISGARGNKGIGPAQNIVPLVISASFTRFDADNMVQDGIAHNAGSRTKRLADWETDDDWDKFAGEASIGETISGRLLSLVINIIDPRNNLVVASQSFDLFFNRENQSIRLRVALGEGYYGFSKSKVVVEGLHGAQKTLIDAAALWILNKTYGGENLFASCFSEEQQRITISAVQIEQEKDTTPTVSQVP
jgi:hypothetical protein